MIDETRIVRNIEEVIRKIKESKSWKIEYCRTKDVVLMFEAILDTIAESKVEQPTQPQGIDKDRLLKDLMRANHFNYYDYDIGAYIECIPVYAVIHIINQQPTLPQPYKERE